MNTLTFVCCFCYESVVPRGDDPVLLVVVGATDPDAEQQLHAHAACLARLVHPSVPLLVEG
jgi:hypothetical protein